MTTLHPLALRLSIVLLLAFAVQGCALASGKNQLRQEVRSANRCAQMTIQARGPLASLILFPSRTQDTAVTWRIELATTLLADSIHIDSISLGETVYPTGALQLYPVSARPARLVVDLQDPSGMLGPQELRIHGSTHANGEELCRLEETRMVDLRIEKSLGVEFLGQ